MLFRSDGIIEYLNEEKNEDKEKDINTILIIDDATSQSNDITNDITFIKAATESRHLMLTCWLVTHDLRKVINRTIRTNIDYLFLYKITNSKLLEAFYYEYMSMLPDFKNFAHFKKIYFDNVMKIKYNGMFLNLLENCYSFDIKDWKVNVSKLERKLETRKKTNVEEINIDPQKDAIRQKLEDKYQRQLIEKKYDKKI